MSLQIPDALQGFVDELIRSGQYDTEGEVIHHALWLLKDQYDLDQLKLAELRKELAIGLEQADRGDVRPFDMERIKREGRKLLKSKRKAG